MPSRQESAPPRITKFTNCRILKNKKLVEQDLWIDSQSGKVLRDQQAFYELQLSPDQVIDLDGRILAPGFIDVQLNGAQGFDYSVPAATREEYEAGLLEANRGLARTGVTSYLPTTVSSTAEVYQQVSLFHERTYNGDKRTSRLMMVDRFCHPWPRQECFVALRMAPSH
jgi:N-acetylglucosamine-6-phosphate deacetylase